MEVCLAVACSGVQCLCSVLQCLASHRWKCVLQWRAVACSVFAVSCSVLHRIDGSCGRRRCAAVFCSVVKIVTGSMAVFVYIHIHAHSQTRARARTHTHKRKQNDTNLAHRAQKQIVNCGCVYRCTRTHMHTHSQTRARTYAHTHTHTQDDINLAHQVRRQIVNRGISHIVDIRWKDVHVPGREPNHSKERWRRLADKSFPNIASR